MDAQASIEPTWAGLSDALATSSGFRKNEVYSSVASFPNDRISSSRESSLDGQGSYLDTLVKLDPASLSAKQILGGILSRFLSVEIAEAHARLLLEEFASLNGLINASWERVAELDVIPHEAWLFLQLVRNTASFVLRETISDRPLLGTLNEVIQYLCFTIGHNTAECVRVLYLDAKKHLIRDELHSVGSPTGTQVYPRELIKRALELRSCGVIIAHNHPCGDPNPSDYDLHMTKLLEEAFHALSMTLHDSIIIGRYKHYSFRERGILG